MDRGIIPQQPLLQEGTIPKTFDLAKSNYLEAGLFEPCKRKVHSQRQQGATTLYYKQDSGPPIVALRYFRLGAFKYKDCFKCL